MLYVRILFLIASAAATGFLNPIQPGVYKHTLEKVRLIATNAEVWTTLELGDIEKEISELTTLSEKADLGCRKSVLPKYHVITSAI